MVMHTNTTRLCALVVILALALTGGLWVLSCSAKENTTGKTMAYETTLFDDSYVHTIDIVIADSDWTDLKANAEDKTYYTCDVVIDGSDFQNVAIRAKGNSSLSGAKDSEMGRYSFKIEFDHYETGKSCWGLDKLSLNNIISDNTYMKDYLCYQLMNEMGVASPLSSFIQVNVNGEAFGLYLAVESIEESFIERTYGSTDGNLYKPDSSDIAGGGGGGGSSTDVALQYTDDDPDSYPNIFSGAIFDADEADQKRLIESLQKLSAGEDLEAVLDVDEIIRYFVVHNFVCNFDSYTGSLQHNYYLYERSGQLSMIAWDYNLAFGAMNMGGGKGGESTTNSTVDSATQYVNYPIDTPCSGCTEDQRPVLNAILTNETYLAQYHAYFDQFLAEYLESGWLTQTIADTYATISSYAQSDPSSYCTYEEFEAGVQALTAFCQLRTESVRGQLEGIYPATRDEQTYADGTYVNASAITLSDMGNNSGGMNRQQPTTQEAADTEEVSLDLLTNMEVDPTADTTADADPTADATAPPTMSGEMRGQRPEGFAGGPGGMGTQTETADTYAVWWLGGSALALLLTTFWALRTKRRRW